MIKFDGTEATYILAEEEWRVANDVRTGTFVRVFRGVKRETGWRGRFVSELNIYKKTRKISYITNPNAYNRGRGIFLNRTITAPFYCLEIVSINEVDIYDFINNYFVGLGSPPMPRPPLNVFQKTVIWETVIKIGRIGYSEVYQLIHMALEIPIPKEVNNEIRDNG